MNKYQFFVIPGTDRQQFTFLEMGCNTFLKQKEQLLNQGFEVDGDVIFADTPEDAVKHFKSNYVYVMEEYNNAHPGLSVIQYLVGRWFKRNKS
jgi:hypothetical protein